MISFPEELSEPTDWGGVLPLIGESTLHEAEG
jgi:hypothetical protein